MSRLFLIISVILVLSCSPRVKLEKALAEDELRFQDHIGLLVYDPQAKRTLVDFNSSKYFTPASNTKIFTFFGGLHLLGDSIPALKYVEQNDSLIIWGAADPSFLYPEVYQNGRAFDFLKNHPAEIYFSASNFYDEHFGPGWAWGDYNSYYSAERSPFPVYGNLITLTDSVDNQLSISPALFYDSVRIIRSMDSTKRAIRKLKNNRVEFETDSSTKSFQKAIPFQTSPHLTSRLLSDTLKREVIMVDKPLPSDARILRSIPSDSLYKVMMQESDNFIAEQLLQMCALMVSDSLNAEIAIDYIKDKYLFDLPDEPQWVDGSGLSRYNLFTPRSIVRLWEKILVLVPRDRLFEMLAIGGKAGTLKNSYKADPPYIFGKTGTLSNNHCISGYLITKKGKLLIFSFMNNNFTAPTREIRANMERILFQIHEKN
jgi:D-alanyl-D-alanine carboxypeptidase/D-alanyl-D-alanine-endopeptidase (penicillin-binding protein 4)